MGKPKASNVVQKRFLEKRSTPVSHTTNSEVSRPTQLHMSALRGCRGRWTSCSHDRSSGRDGPCAAAPMRHAALLERRAAPSHACRRRACISRAASSSSGSNANAAAPWPAAVVPTEPAPHQPMTSQAPGPASTLLAAAATAAARPLVSVALQATRPYLGNLSGDWILTLLRSCVWSRTPPPPGWVRSLVDALPSPHTWYMFPRAMQEGLLLLQLLAQSGTPPPVAWLDQVYSTVSCHRASLDLDDLILFLSACSYLRQYHPMQCDQLLTLTAVLVADDGELLAGASPQQLAQLLPLIAAASGQAPSLALTSAVLERLQPLVDCGAAQQSQQLQHQAQQPQQLGPGQASGTSGVGGLSPHAIMEQLEAAAGPGGGPSGSQQLPQLPALDSTILAYERALLRALPALNLQDRVRALACLGACGLPPGAAEELRGQVRAALTGLREGLGQLEAVRLTALVVALQRLGVAPDVEWTESYHAALKRRLAEFEDSDWLIDTLEALKALDRQLGFKALDQVAASTVARCRPSQPPQHAPHTSTHTASDPAPQSTLQGAVAGPAELANVLFLLANLNHNPGHKPILAIAGALQPHLHSLSGQQLTNVLWSLARLGTPPLPPGWLAEAATAASALLLQPLPPLPSYIPPPPQPPVPSPADAFNILVRAPFQPPQPQRQRPCFRATLRTHQVAFLFASLQTLGAPLDRQWVDEVLEVVRRSLPSCLPSDVALVLNTIARLKHVTSYAWMAEVEAHVSNALDKYEPREITTVLYAMAKLHHRPPSEWLQAVEDAFADRLTSFQADNLSTLVWAMTQLGHTPSTLTLDNFCRAVQEQLPAFETRDLAALLPSLAAFNYQPDPAWLAAYLAVLQYHLPLLDLAGFTAVAQALGDLGARLSNAEWWSAYCNQMAPRIASASPKELTALATALIKCQCVPPEEPSPWSEAVVSRFSQVRTQMSTEEVASLALDLGQLGVSLPADIVSEVVVWAGPNLSTLTPTRIAGLASCCAKSDAPTSRIFLESLAATCRSSLYSFSMIDLHTLTKAISKINDRVSPPMPALSDLLAQLHEWMMY